MSDLMNFSAAELEAIWLSVKVAIACVVISLPLAIWVGYKMARYDFKGKAIIESFIHLPLVMPPVATGYLLLVIFGTKGIVGGWLNQVFGMRLAFSFYAAIIASVVVSFPLIVRAIRTSMEMIDTGLEDASRVLGASRWRTFMKITIPLAMPGIISGTILAFARSLGEFGATITFAGNIAGETQTLPLAIYAKMQVPGQESATMRLVIVAVIISFIAMVLSEWYIKKMKHDRG